MKEQLIRLRSAAVRTLVGPAVARVQTLADRTQRLLHPSARPASSGLAPPLAQGQLLKELLSSYYLEGRYAQGAQPVAWVTSGAPVEVLRALGYYVVYPENHAALCGARRLGAALAEQAEHAGYPPDICSYARIDLGSWLSGRTPVGRIPRPDLLLACTNICQTVLYWFRELARLTGAPLFLLDTPFVHGPIRPHVRHYVRDQLQQLGQVAGEVAHRRLELDRLEAVLVRSQEAITLWRRALDLARRRPAPWGAFDMFIFMAPIVMLRGLPSAVRFYQGLVRELERRVQEGVGAVRGERLRLLWDNLPIWHRLRRLSHVLAQHQACLVGATYTYAWAESGEGLDPGRPWLSLAEAYLKVYLNRDLESRYRLLVEHCRELAVDGVVFHANRSCKPYSVGQQELARRLQQELGIHCLVLEADHADERLYVDEAIEGRLEAFLETCG